jgi:hypothetical protein
MKSHVRRAIETLEALGFENRANDYDRAQRRRLYLHPNYPDEAPIRLWDSASEAACTGASARAYKIVDLADAGPRPATTIRERYRAQREREELERSQRAEAELRRAAAKRSQMTKQELEAAYYAALSTGERKRLMAEESNHKFYASLMQPSYGR